MSRTATRNSLGRWLWVLWPLAVLAIAWLIAPFKANAEFPGLPCTAGAASLLERFSYLLFFLPTAVILLVLTALGRRALRRGVRLWSLAFAGLAVVAAVLYLAFGALSAQPSGEHAVACPPAAVGFTPLHCWKRSSPDVFEMNAFGRRPLDQAGAEALGRALAATRQDVFLDEAFVLDSRDEAWSPTRTAGYSSFSGQSSRCLGPNVSPSARPRRA